MQILFFSLTAIELILLWKYSDIDRNVKNQSNHIYRRNGVERRLLSYEFRARHRAKTVRAKVFERHSFNNAKFAFGRVPDRLKMTPVSDRVCTSHRPLANCIEFKTNCRYPFWVTDDDDDAIAVSCVLGRTGTWHGTYTPDVPTISIKCIRRVHNVFLVYLFSIQLFLCCSTPIALRSSSVSSSK